MLYRWFSKVKNRKELLTLTTFRGFGIVELMTSLSIVLVAFLAIMILFRDVVENQTQDGIIEAIRYNMETSLDMIVEDVKNASSVVILPTLSGLDKIELYYDLPMKNNSDSLAGNSLYHYYTALPDKGIMYDGTKIKGIGLGYQPFEDQNVYEVKIEKFDFGNNALNDYDTNNENLQKAFCELELTFSIESRIVEWEDGPKTYNFKRRFFSLNTFAKTNQDKK